MIVTVIWFDAAMYKEAAGRDPPVNASNLVILTFLSIISMMKFALARKVVVVTVPNWRRLYAFFFHIAYPLCFGLLN